MSFFFRAIPTAYGSSQARGWIGAAATLQPHQHRTWAVSANYTAAHHNTGSLTHWLKPGIEPTSSWILVKLFLIMATPIFMQFYRLISIYNQYKILAISCAVKIHPWTYLIPKYFLPPTPSPLYFPYCYLLLLTAITTTATTTTHTPSHTLVTTSFLYVWAAFSCYIH